MMLFMPEGWQSLPQRERWRGLVSCNLIKFPITELCETIGFEAIIDFDIEIFRKYRY